MLSACNGKSFGAVIVEPRKHPALKFVLQNVLDKTPMNMPVIVIRGTLNGPYVEQIVRDIDSDKRITIRNCGKANLPIPAYNKLLLSKRFWTSLPFDVILIFQTDSIILSRDRNAICEFLKYSYIGAPSKRFPDKVNNGGFSIRSKRFCLQALQHIVPKRNEDVEFREHLYHPKFSANYVVPSASTGARFSVESFYHPAPFGVHKPWRHLGPELWKTFIQNFPELETLRLLQYPKSRRIDSGFPFATKNVQKKLMPGRDNTQHRARKFHARKRQKLKLAQRGALNLHANRRRQGHKKR